MELELGKGGDGEGGVADGGGGGELRDGEPVRRERDGVALAGLEGCGADEEQKAA